MPTNTKNKIFKRNPFETYVIAFVFALGFGGLGTYFLSQSQAATNPAATITGIAGKCLDNSGNKAVDGNKIDLWSCNGTKAQKWRVNGNASSANTIVNINGYCLGISGGHTAPLTKIILYHCDGNTSQQWYYNSSNGRITNKLSGSCMDDYASGTTNGNQIDIYPCNGTKAQKWHYNAPPPSVSITAPGSGSTVSGSSVTFSANASTSAGYTASISLIANGVTLHTCTNASACAVGWDTTRLKNGTYTLRAKASNSINGSAAASESVTISNSAHNPPPPQPPPPPGPGPNPNPGPGPSPSPNPSQSPSPHPTPKDDQNSFSTVPTTSDPIAGNIQATTITSSSIMLSWQGANSNSYLIKYGTNSSSLNNSRTVSSTDAVPTYTLTKLSPNSTYYITITPSSDSATGAAVDAKFKTKDKNHAALVFFWILLTIVVLMGIMFFLVRRRLIMDESVDNTELTQPPADVTIYPREDEQHESERLNWWMPEEQRHKVAQHSGQNLHEHKLEDDVPDMYEEGRNRLENEQKKH